MNYLQFAFVISFFFYYKLMLPHASKKHKVKNNPLCRANFQRYKGKTC